MASEDEFLSVRWDRDSTISNNAQTPKPSDVRSPHLRPKTGPLLSSSPQFAEDIPEEDSGKGKEKEHTSEIKPSKKGVFINSRVSSPQKENEGQNAYISYLIETHTNDPLFQSTHMKVRRRFSDFYFLYQCLMNDYQSCALPPLPDKKRLNYLKGDRFGYDFTSKRMSSLDRFLKRMSLHPVLKDSKIYRIFLESTDWNAYKESLNVAHFKNVGDPGDPLGPASTVSDSLSDLFMNAFKHPQAQPNKEFVEINERCNKLNDNVVKIDKSFQKYVKRLGDLSNNFHVFADLIVKLDEIGPIPNEDAAKSPEAPQKDGKILPKAPISSQPISSQPIMKPLPVITDEIKNGNSSYAKFSSGLENLAFGLNNLKRYLDNDYLISLKDLENYIYSIKNLIKVKEQKQIDYEALSEYLARAIHEKNSLLQQTSGTPINGSEELTIPHNTSVVANNPNIPLPSPKPSTLTTIASSTSNFLTSKIDDIRGINSSYQKKERLIKLSVKIETLEREVVNAKQIFEAFENEILHEVQYFDVIKSNELKGNLKQLSGHYITFYKNLISEWETVEQTLEKDIANSSEAVEG